MEFVSCERPVYVMLIGLPGSGKSTFASRNLGFLEPFVYSSDAELEKHAAALGKTYNEVFAEYIKGATTRAEVGRTNAFLSDRNVVDDHTNLTVETRARRLKGVPDKYTKYAVVVEADEHEIGRRRDQRVGKTIPHFVLAKMAASFRHPTVSEGFTTITLV